jgi:predicted metal-dependent peptidase
MSEDLSKIECLATEIFHLSRNTILISFRFMDAALAELKLSHTTDIRGMATEGTHLIYNPLDVLKTYSNEKYVINRDYLHLLLHCLYRHNFVTGLLDEKIWDLACDITVENIINELSVSHFDAQRAGKQETVISDLKSKLKILTAEKIYRHYLDRNLSLGEIAKIRTNFFADDHFLWYQRESLSALSGYDVGKSGEYQNSAWRTNFLSFSDRNIQESRWQVISERMQQDLEIFSKEHGNSAGSLVQNLGEVNREKYDYAAFLKKFAVMGETMKINDDEFDYVFYTYGLNLYKKLPLVEPLEYKDVRRIREFAIIIDTSGSVSGELVQTFINKTYNILKDTESFFSKINLYIIQCDAEIQEVTKITSQNEINDYIRSKKLHGFGGTDFRPAFNYIDNLVKSGELARLKGIIYFSDGWGIFPEKKPLYDVAFVFIREDIFNPNVPPWAIKLVLDKEDV